MKALLFIIFQFLILHAYAQIDNESISVVESILRKEHASGTLIYAERLSKSSIAEMKSNLKKRKYYSQTKSNQKQTFLLSRRERHKIYDIIKSHYSHTWKDSLFSDSRRISNDSIWSYMTRKNKETNKAFFIDSLRGSYVKHLVQNANTFQFSIPIFLRDKRILIFYYIRQCGSLCGVTDLSIYKQEGGVYKKQIQVINGAF